MLWHASLTSMFLAAGLACVPAHALQRAFVSSAGNDANAPSGCVLTMPCRSFQAAHNVVDVGGEIVALDTAGFAPVTITKSVSILGNPGFIAGISVATGHGVTIATPGLNVVLRNVTINGLGGVHGVDMTAASSLTLENCVISNFSVGVYSDAAGGIRILNSVMRGNSRGAHLAGIAWADVVNSQFLGNAAFGLYVEQGAGATTKISVNDSVASGNGTGFFLWGYSGTARMSLIRSTAANNALEGFHNRGEGAGASLMMVGSSMASGNGTGFANVAAGGGTATFESLGNNIVRQNTAASSGTITAIPGL